MYTFMALKSFSDISYLAEEENGGDFTGLEKNKKEIKCLLRCQTTYPSSVRFGSRIHSVSVFQKSS